MKKGLFNIKIKYDGVPIVDSRCDDVEEVEKEVNLFKKKFGR